VFCRNVNHLIFLDRFLPLYRCGINHWHQQSTLEQDNDAPQMPVCLRNWIEPNKRWADPSKAKLFVCV